MTSENQFELRVSDGVDPDLVIQLIKDELANSQNFDIASVTVKRPLGVTGVEIAIAILINIGTGIVIQVYRDEIDAAAKKVSDKVKSAIRVIFPDD